MRSQRISVYVTHKNEVLNGGIMFYSIKFINDLGYKSIEEFVEDFMKRHNNCFISYKPNGVYLSFDYDSEVGMPNLGYDSGCTYEHV